MEPLYIVAQVKGRKVHDLKRFGDPDKVKPMVKKVGFSSPPPPLLILSVINWTVKERLIFIKS